MDVEKACYHINRCSLHFTFLCSGRCVHTLAGHRGEISSTQAGNVLCEAFGTNFILLLCFSLISLEITASLEVLPASQFLSCVARALSDHNMCSLREDRTCKLWDVNNGQCMETMRGHSDEAQTECFRPRQLSPQSDPDTEQVLDVCFNTTGNRGLPRQGEGERQPLQSMLRSGGCSCLCTWPLQGLVTASADCTARVYNVRNPRCARSETQ